MGRKPGRQTVLRRNKELESTRRVNLVYEFIKDGKTHSEITEYFVRSYPDIKQFDINNYISKAKLLVANDVERDATYLIALHTKRYDELWHCDKDSYITWIYDPQEGADFANNGEILRKYFSLLQALRQKEDLYQLHSKEARNAVIEIISGKVNEDPIYAAKGSPKTMFDFSQLQINELIEFKVLLDVCKVYQEQEEEYIYEDENKTVKTLKQEANFMYSREIEQNSLNRLKNLRRGYDNFIKSVEERKTASVKVIDSTPEITEEQKKLPREVSLDIKRSILEEVKKAYSKKS
jgi:hypothetical protein